METILVLSSRSSVRETCLASLKEKRIHWRRFGPQKKYALVKAKLSQKFCVGNARQPNYRYYSKRVDPETAQSWGLENRGYPDSNGQVGVPTKDIGAVAAWALPERREEVVVAVIDSGVDLSHPELNDQLWVNSKEVRNGRDDDGNGFADDQFGWNFVEDNHLIDDEFDHGTLVSGIIAAKANNHVGSRGVNDQARLMILKIMDGFGVGTTANAIRALTYAVEQGAKIINASWGGTHHDGALLETLRWVGEQGVLVVAAAGNAGEDNADGKPTYPAAYQLTNLISVAAYDNRDVLWEHSNRGKTSVHLGAPGVGIFGPRRNRGYGFGTGTSYAAPFVSGVASLLKGQEPALLARELKERLQSTSEVIHFYEKERLVSAGRVHAYNVLEDIRPVRPKSPTKWQRLEKKVESPHPYLNNSETRYSLGFPGATFLRARFRRLEFESDVDFLEVRDREGLLVEKLSGKAENIWSAEVLGDRMELTLKSDYVTQGFGFEIDALEVSLEKNTWLQARNKASLLPRFFSLREKLSEVWQGIGLRFPF